MFLLLAFLALPSRVPCGGTAAEVLIYGLERLTDRVNHLDTIARWLGLLVLREPAALA